MRFNLYFMAPPQVEKLRISASLIEGKPPLAQEKECSTLHHRGYEGENTDDSFCKIMS